MPGNNFSHPPLGLFQSASLFISSSNYTLSEARALAAPVLNIAYGIGGGLHFTQGIIFLVFFLVNIVIVNRRNKFLGKKTSSFRIEIVISIFCIIYSFGMKQNVARKKAQTKIMTPPSSK